MDWNHQPGTYVYFLDLQNSIAPRRKKIRHLQAVPKNCSKKVDEKYLWSNLFPIYAPCMVYLPTFGWFFRANVGNIPYMEHMGLVFLLVPTQKTLPRHQRWRVNIRISMGKSSNEVVAGILPVIAIPYAPWCCKTYQHLPLSKITQFCRFFIYQHHGELIWEWERIHLDMENHHAINGTINYKSPCYQ